MHELDAPRAPGLETIALASLSDAGRVRSENQDAIALLENTSRERLILVADGMGGHRGGETASRICLQMLERVFREPHGTPDERLRRGIDLANEEIYSHALANPELRGMGTTVVVALIAPDGRAWLAWVGDSRCYRLRAGALERLTRDHSLMSEWISIGVITEATAETHPRRHELTRALGQSPDVPVDLVPLELRPGDRLLLCSDGLHGCVVDRAIRPLLAHHTPDEVVHALVDAANAAGGTDNISVVIVDVPGAAAPAIAPTIAPVPEPVLEPLLPQTPAPSLAAELPFELQLVPPPAPPDAPAFTPAPEIEPLADLTPDIAAELTVAPAFELAPASEPTPEAKSAFELNPEFSFADLDAEIAQVTAESTNAGEATSDLVAPTRIDSLEAAPEPELPVETLPAPEPDPEPLPVFEPEFLLPAEQRIQIPLMTPVHAKRGLDAISLAAGVVGTLVVVGLAIGAWLYTRSSQALEPAVIARPAPAIVRAPSPLPVVIPKPIPQAPPEPLAPPVAKSAPPAMRAPAASATPTPAIAVRAPEVPAAPAPSVRAQPESVPASADPSSAELPPSAHGFELPPNVVRFVDDWLRALATHDRASLEALGFADEPSAFAGTSGSRDGFRLVAAEIDEERSRVGRIYLRMVVSYAFRDATGRFRTQDQQRLILRNVGGRLRFEGRWRQ